MHGRAESHGVVRRLLIGLVPTPTDTKGATMATRKTRKRASENNAFDILRADHRKVEKLFDEFEDLDREDTEACQEIVVQACTELKIHATVEEELFYPALREALDEDDASLLDEAVVEHATAKMLIARLEELEAEDPQYSATFTVLSEYIKHHVKEEEREIFPKAKKAKVDADDLGTRMRARKEELMTEMGLEEAVTAD
jgi:hemerythrin superfamily protein